MHTNKKYHHQSNLKVLAHKEEIIPNFNGPSHKQQLAWLWSKEGLKTFKPNKIELIRIPNLDWANTYGDGNQTSVSIQGDGVAIVLTETGWYLEDTSGG